jgi:hypothetical protein
MLGRKDYTRSELDVARARIEDATARFGAMASAAAKDPKTAKALTAFEATYFNDLVLVLDRLFVHRVRKVAGSDGNPLNEVELLVDSLMLNGGDLRALSPIKYVPANSVLHLELGNEIRLSADDFTRLSSAFFAELEAKFLSGPR